MPLPPIVEPGAELTRHEVARYSRHLLLPGVGVEGQRRLKNARVLVIGAGGLGSPTLLYPAAAGVGTLGIVEFDVVEESNLQRQIIHGTSDVGRSKGQSAREAIAELNPLVPHHRRPQGSRRAAHHRSRRLRGVRPDGHRDSRQPEELDAQPTVRVPARRQPGRQTGFPGVADLAGHRA